MLIVDKEPIHFRDDVTIKIDEGGVAFTIPSSMNNLGLCIMQRTWCVGNGQLDQARLSDKVGALNCMHDQQAVCAYGIDVYNQEISGDTAASLTAASGGVNTSGPKVMTYGIIRRLTPLECERLQGLPDNWTDIGEWIDKHGKKRDSSDTARYKALGNSIALPFWQWLMNRISAQYDRPATLGSLFDGIGGFPLCWERCNGKGTAIWASEIEEFPIAVTRLHFPEGDK